MAFQLIPAGPGDRSSLADFLEEAPFIHRHLDWQPALDWLGSQPFWMALENKKIQAAIACPDDPSGVAWLRLFASRSPDHLRDFWIGLFEKCQMEYSTRPETIYAAISLHPWFEELLMGSGFGLKQKIVVLEWTDMKEPELTPLSGIIVRPITKEDLPAVARVDQAAFDLLWQNSIYSLTLSFNQAAYTTVAELDGEIVGYQICTGFHYSAHLARLAVMPQVQGKSIGKLLVVDLLRNFYQRNIVRVSVNTQADNARSLSLYQRLGFAATGDTFNVFVLN